jgi:hypothetical protein
MLSPSAAANPLLKVQREEKWNAGHKQMGTAQLHKRVITFGVR